MMFLSIIYIEGYVLKIGQINIRGNEVNSNLDSKLVQIGYISLSIKVASKDQNNVGGEHKRH